MTSTRKKQPDLKRVTTQTPTEPPAAKAAASLSGLETEVMQVVWKLGTVSGADVRKALEPGRPLARTTVLTVLENLRKKKAVRVVPSVGREKKFRAAVARETVVSQVLRTLRGRFFDGSAASLVAHLIRSGEVDKQELDEIEKVIEQSKREGEGQ
jgi:predicted transcriptional regulator